MARWVVEGDVALGTSDETCEVGRKMKREAAMAGRGFRMLAFAETSRPNTTTTIMIICLHAGSISAGALDAASLLRIVRITMEISG
jgi:hypothetical protein